MLDTFLGLLLLIVPTLSPDQISGSISVQVIIRNGSQQRWLAYRVRYQLLVHVIAIWIQTLQRVRIVVQTLLNLSR